VELSQEHPISVTEEHCKRFIEIFDASKTGVLSKKEFADFVKFIFMMRWAEQVETEAIEGELRVHGMLDMVRQDKKAVGRLSVNPMLPPWMLEQFADPSFQAQCEAHFDKLDRNKDGSLCAAEIVPVIVELSQEHPIAITEEHCKHFIEIFDASKTGVLSKSEFADFVKFIFMMQWAEQAEFENQALEGELRIHGMLDMVRQDKKAVGSVSVNPMHPP
jgi:Ca2+-binding EF-hand superfamily protein